MKLSIASIKTQKSRIANSNELLSTQIMFQAGLLHRYGTGIYGKHNFLARVQYNIEQVIRQVLDKYDCIEVSLPILQSEAMWQSSGRWDSYLSSGELFTTDNNKFCLAPTAEEAMLEFVRNNLNSHKDLPVTLYQIGSKFRNEIRSHGGLLRGKEFTMMDAYSFHSSEESLKEEYEKMKKAYLEIFHKLDLQVVTVAALSGDIGGNHSEEFMVLSEKGQDTILVNEDHTIGFNTEILESDNASDYLKKFSINDLSQLSEKHCIELGHIFQLGQKYSHSMNATFKNASNEDIPFYMGCYGIGTSRLMAAIAETNCDKDGLCWPTEVAPYKVMIIYTHDKKDEAFSLYDEFQYNKIPVIIDDRDGIRVGAKTRDWKLFGIPYLIFVGKNFDENVLEIEIRKDGSKKRVHAYKLFNSLKN